MACFLVPAAEALIVSAVKRHNEKKAPAQKIDAAFKPSEHSELKNFFAKKTGVLSNMLWGGSILLLFEHIWHGEITAFPPFLTAMQTAQGTMEMLSEMATTGVAMAGIVTAAWALGVLAAAKISKKRKKFEKENSQLQEG